MKESRGTGNRGGLHPGKIPIDVLEKTVLRLTGKESEDVVTPPKAGLDFAAIRIGSRYLIVSADPITGVTRNIGEYAINVSANDVATSGNGPQFAECVVLLPEGSGRKEVREVAAQMDSAAKKLGIAIVGGHTEVAQSLLKPVVSVTAFSVVDSYVSSADAEEGDTIMMTKTAGLEGSAVMSGTRGLIGGRVTRRVVRRASAFRSRISIVEEAVAAFRSGEARAMHDCTEGGVLGAVFEMSRASGLGFTLREKAVPVAPETRAICDRLSLDPLKLIGSGSLLIAVKPGREEKVRSALGGVRISRVGEFVRKNGTLVRRDGTETEVVEAPEDELWRVLGGPA